ncbi:MAG: carboxylesterase/lipase family protein [Burkholderiaceae bacterium]
MTDQVQAHTSCGTLVGSRDGGVCRFSAIPYAAAPVGALRWAPPQPARWTGTLDARAAGPIPPQRPSRLRVAMGDIVARQSEDCLHLTVWTPAPDAMRRPVVVWLHGGAWQSGAGALPWYDGAHLAALGDVVVVAVNYRLAAMGWLHVPGETTNVGLLDQEAAVAWVRAHIDSFGGDPSRLTLMGQSAGASNIVCMLARAPLFERAILQSAALGRGPRDAAIAKQLGHTMLAAAGVDNLDQARALSVEAVLQLQEHPAVLKALQQEGEGRSLFGLTADGAIVPADWDAACASARARADVLIGSTEHEMRAFQLPDEVRSASETERIFGAPARQWALHAAEAGRQAWLYCFAHAPNVRFGACHCIELPFVFDTVEAFAGAAMLDGLREQDARRLTREMQGAWLAFIRGEAPGWHAGAEARRFA